MALPKFLKSLFSKKPNPRAPLRNKKRQGVPETPDSICIMYRSFNREQYMYPPRNIQARYHRAPAGETEQSNGKMDNFMPWGNVAEFRANRQHLNCPTNDPFTAHEKVRLRQSVMNIIKNSTTMVQISKELPKPGDSSYTPERAKGDPLNLNDLFSSGEEGIGFYKHMKRLEYFFGSTSREVQLQVKYSLKKIHTVLTDPTELLVFTDARDQDFPPVQSAPNSVGHAINVSKPLLNMATTEHFRERVIYHDLVSQILTTGRYSKHADNSHNQNFYRKYFLMQRSIGNPLKNINSQFTPVKDHTLALLNPITWVNFLDSCCRKSDNKDWVGIEIGALKTKPEEAYEVMEYFDNI